MRKFYQNYDVKGILQTLDRGGRFVIPYSFRQQLGLDYAGAVVEVLLVEDGILLIPANTNKQAERQP